MTFAQVTPEQPPDEPEPQREEEQAASDDDTGSATTDILKQAQARRLESMELERAADEGMPAPGAGSGRPDGPSAPRR